MLERKTKLSQGEKSAEVAEGNDNLWTPSELKIVSNDPSSSKSTKVSYNVTENNEYKPPDLEKICYPIVFIHFLNFWIIYQQGFTINNMVLFHLNILCSK